LLPDDLDQHPVPTVTVELAAKNLLPWVKVQPAIGDDCDDLPTHQLHGVYKPPKIQRTVLGAPSAGTNC
jgi:hypothetical protein